MKFLWLVGTMLVASAAQAQPHCKPREEVLSHLYGTYDEIKNVQGVLSNEPAVVEIFSSQPDGERGRSFTIIVSYPNGMSCVAMVGHWWRYVTDKGI